MLQLLTNIRLLFCCSQPKGVLLISPGKDDRLKVNAQSADIRQVWLTGQLVCLHTHRMTFSALVLPVRGSSAPMMMSLLKSYVSFLVSADQAVHRVRLFADESMHHSRVLLSLMQWLQV